MSTDRDIDIAVRIATLEARSEEGSRDREQLKQGVAELHEQIETVNTTLNTMRLELERYRGFWGGVLLILGAVGTALTLAFKYLGVNSQ